MTDNAVDAALDPAEAEAFRAKCTAFLDQHATGLEIVGEDPRSDQSVAQSRAFQQKVADAGLAGIIYPKEFGGLGLTRAHERIWREEYGNYPDMTGQLTISHGMCMPMMAEYGTDEQKTEFLAKQMSAEHLWCQMFSEPGAGSDVASLQTRAVLDGDEWTINGQKVWTTLAHQCDYGILIARTDPDQPKHRGITMFIVNMKDPAIEIRPINQIDGGKHFNEVFFTDLRIPKSWQVGELNDGWRLATAMLMYERVAIGTGQTSGIKTPNYKWWGDEAARRGRTDEPLVRQELMRLYSQEATKSLVALRTRAELKAGKTPGPGGSLGKLHGAKIARLTRSLGLEILGPEGVAWESAADAEGSKWSNAVLRSFSANIAGGTDEIQKNIIGDRVLGLPREPSVDKDVPFSDLKTGTQS
ncbi:MAG: alkylation response protein AidB-like acyl-CoA dehydrogenase [Acidimicrobiales bacterium]|jgi:alkylation response protein AidB-like acyl-CoA dehydrogenase